MKYKRIEKDNYDLYYYKTNKFKTINITTLIINKMDEKNITLDNFLSSYLLVTNKKYNNEISMNKKYMDLYDPNFSIYDIYRDLHYKFFDMTFLDEKYLEKDNNKKIIDFYYDSIFSLNETNNKLDKTQTKLIKGQMKTNYLLDEEDPMEKAYYNSFKLISDDLPIKINPKGNIKDLKRINTKDSYKYYKDQIKNGRVVVFLTGNIDDKLISFIDDKLKNKIHKNNYDIKTIYDVTNVNKVTKEVEDTSFNESILYLIYKIPNITKREREIVLPLFNNILGGSSSKLFNNVREKNSLAYYAYSNFIKHFGIIYMYAGINFKNYKKTIELMKDTLDDMKKGNISLNEIKDSKEAITSSLIKNEDNIYSIVNDMITTILFDKVDKDTLRKEIVTVTKKELIDLSKKLELDVEYLLKGVNHENN